MNDVLIPVQSLIRQLQQKESDLLLRNETLESKIEEHNEECIRLCELNRSGSHMSCDPRYGPDKRRTCPECPRDWMIEE